MKISIFKLFILINFTIVLSFIAKAYSSVREANPSSQKISNGISNLENLKVSGKCNILFSGHKSIKTSSSKQEINPQEPILTNFPDELRSASIAVIELQLLLQSSMKPESNLKFLQNLYSEKLRELYSEFLKRGYTKYEIESIYAKLYEEIKQAKLVDQSIENQEVSERSKRIKEQRNSLPYPLKGRTLQVVNEILRQLNKTNAEEVSWAELMMIKRLDLFNKGIESLQLDDFKGLVGIKGINLNQNKLKSIHSDIFMHNPDLESIFLNNNNLSILKSDTFKYNPNLLGIYLDTNQIISIHPETFKHNLKLRSLHLQYNQLRSIHQDTFRHNPDLTWLYLNHNKLNTIHGDVFSHNVSLKGLFLEHNLLGYIESNTFKNNKFIRQLHLNDNLFSSDELNRISQLLGSKIMDLRI